MNRKLSFRRSWTLVVITLTIVFTLAVSPGCDRQSTEGKSTIVETGPSPVPKNLLMITIDTLRADHVSCYGYARDTSPRIDELARNGIQFMQVESQWPKTTPSFASMLTSTYPLQNGVRKISAKLDSRLFTLAEILSTSGFYTGAIVSNPYVSSKFNFHQGFSEMIQTWDKVKRPEFWSNERIANNATSWLQKHQTDRFFLWVHFLDPHGPYLPPKELASSFKNDAIWYEQGSTAPRDSLEIYHLVAEHETMADFIAAYDAELLSTDKAVGTILDELVRLGLRDETLVVLTSDHGESMGEHDYFFEHGLYPYEACSRVPLIFSSPTKLDGGRQIETPVALLDVLPTILELLTVNPGPAVNQIQGRSLAAAIQGSRLEDEPVFIQASNNHFAVRLDRWKYVCVMSNLPNDLFVNEREQLYDLEFDPLETRNIIKDNPEVAGTLQAILADWRMNLQLQGFAYEEQVIPNNELDPTVIEKLRSLGYIGNSNDERRTHQRLDTQT